MTARPRRKAVVAMSGGVDSSVAAALLKEEGYAVTGVMLKLWRGEEANTNSGCCNLGAAEDARRVADVLGIRFYVLNFSELFQTVIRDFHAMYASGRTPNPCVRCNQWIKFDALLERARALGADVLATGHYARVRSTSRGYRLLRGIDPHKDQTYVLWMLSQSDLAQCRFPIGEMDKTETRRIASDLGLRTAAKPDSQEICFVAEGDLPRYVTTNMPEASRPGPIVGGGGRVLGEHRGIGRYTVGQRRGLGISVGTPMFVTRVNAASNTVVVGPREELRAGSFVAEETSFVESVPDGAKVLIQHRAHGGTSRATVRRAGRRRVEVRFDEPVEALAPGQSAVFYSVEDSDILLGGGIIAATAPVEHATR